jgi:MerR HTH family regulatory protein
VKAKFTLRELLKASGTSKTKLDQWISRDHIKPSMEPEPGRTRLFTAREAMQIVTIVELTRLGLPVADAVRHTAHLTAFKDSPTVLVVWQGPGEIIRETPRGSPAPKKHMHPVHRYPAIPPDGLRSTGGYETVIQSCIVRPAALADMVLDPDKWSLMAVNLDRIEAKLDAAAADDDGE